MITTKFRKNNTPITISSENYQGEVNAIFVMGTDGYICSYETNNANSLAKVWENGETQNLTGSSDTAVANGFFVTQTQE